MPKVTVPQKPPARNGYIKLTINVVWNRHILRNDGRHILLVVESAVRTGEGAAPRQEKRDLWMFNTLYFSFWRVYSCLSFRSRLVNFVLDGIPMLVTRGRCCNRSWPRFLGMPSENKRKKTRKKRRPMQNCASVMGIRWFISRERIVATTKL